MCKESVQRSAQSRNDIILNNGLYLNIYLYIYGEMFHTPTADFVSDICRSQPVNYWKMQTLETDYSYPILPISRKGHHSNTAFPCAVERDITLTLTAFPRAVQEIECPFHPLPVLEVEKGVGDSFAVASLQDVLW